MNLFKRIFPLIGAITGIAVIIIAPGCSHSETRSVPAATTPNNRPAQIWELTESERHQKARISIEPFTARGDFTETGDSPGWWTFGSQGERLYKFPISGSIVHDEPGDIIWYFDGFTDLGKGYSTWSTGQGRTTGNYPEAVSASGSITFTTNSPLGTATGTVDWTAVRIE